MNQSDWIGLGSMLLAAIGILLGIFKYFNARIAAVFRRFDEHKRFCDDNFVRIPMCGVIHDTTSKDMRNIWESLKDISHKIDAIINKIGGTGDYHQR